MLRTRNWRRLGSTTTLHVANILSLRGLQRREALINQIITYDAFNMAEVFLTQPLQIVAGSGAGSKWMSDDLYNRAASVKKNFHVLDGANHMSLYDVPQYVDEAVSVLAPSFTKNLAAIATADRHVAAART
jgi:hypothetical protein